jgi:hypothetical protein
LLNLCNACCLFLEVNGSLPPETCNVVDELEGPCVHCHADSSAQWRAGPESGTVCDTCGMYYRKHKKLPLPPCLRCSHCKGPFTSSIRIPGPSDAPVLCNACGKCWRRKQVLPTDEQLAARRPRRGPLDE